MKDKEIFEKIYEKPGAVWTSSKPHPELVELIDSKKIDPCKTLEIGCGEGRDLIYLAKQGFDVLGIDLSKKAINYVKKNLKKAGVLAKFISMDLRELEKLNEKFDFVLEYAVMHHIRFEDREKYVKNVNNLLNDKGYYLSVCFNIKSPDWGMKNERYRKSPVGTYLFYSSLDELNKLFEKYFDIIESKIVNIDAGKQSFSHIANYFFMKKK